MDFSLARGLARIFERGGPQFLKYLNKFKYLYAILILRGVPRHLTTLLWTIVYPTMVYRLPFNPDFLLDFKQQDLEILQSVHTLACMLDITHICNVTIDRHQKKIYFLCFFSCHSPANTLIKKNLCVELTFEHRFAAFLTFFLFYYPLWNKKIEQQLKNFLFLLSLMSYICLRYDPQTVFLTRFVTELLKIDFRLSHSLVFFGMNFN